MTLRCTKLVVMVGFWLLLVACGSGVTADTADAVGKKVAVAIGTVRTLSAEIATVTTSLAQKPLFPQSKQVGTLQRARPNLLKEDKSVVAKTERKLQEVLRRVRPAIVVADDSKASDGTVGDTGVIVTADGYVLMPPQTKGRALTFHLADGRRLPGKMLGWSKEWGIALAKIEGQGRYPFVPLRKGTTVRAGQPLVTFFHALNEKQKAQVHLEWADRSARGMWFMRPEGTRYEWQMRGSVAFDLDGRFLGIENATFPRHGTIFTHIERARTLWSHLIAGRDVDALRLHGKTKPDEAVSPHLTEQPTIAAEVEARAVAASVRILFRPGVTNAYVTGTLVSADGQIATCAHHFALPGDKVMVALSDGRDVPGEVVGLNFPADVSLIRITAPGVYPFVKIGDSRSMRPGDPCLLIGYGPVDRQSRLPGVRRTSIVAPKEGMNSLHLTTTNTVRIVGGDSGGGLFDRDGRLVGFSPESSGLPDAPLEHVRIETLQAQQKDLRVPFERAAHSEVLAVDAALEASANQVRASTVEVLSDGKATALGTIIGAGGTILTKASALRGSLTCRLSDGRTLAATQRTVWREHDLALLKIEADNLTAVRWEEGKEVPVGALVGLAGVCAVRGTVSHAAQEIEADRGVLGVTLQDTAQGAEVVELESEDFLPEEEGFRFAPQFLQKGDMVLSVNGQPTATRKQLSDLLDPKRRDVPAVAGDWVRLKMRRAGVETEQDFQLRPWGLFPLSGQTARNSGFARVYGVAVEKDPTLFGGAVIDREGRAIGVAIAARHKGWVLVLPVAVITETMAPKE